MYNKHKKVRNPWKSLICNKFQRILLIHPASEVIVNRTWILLIVFSWKNLRTSKSPSSYKYKNVLAFLHSKTLNSIFNNINGLWNINHTIMNDLVCLN